MILQLSFGKIFSDALLLKICYDVLCPQIYEEGACTLSRPQTGHIRQRKNGLWEGQYIYKKERRSIYCRTQEEVSRQLDEIIESIERGNYIRPNQHTLFSWLMEWLHSYAEPTLRPSTFTNYKMHIERYFNNKLGRVKLITYLPACYKTFSMKNWSQAEWIKNLAVCHPKH